MSELTAEALETALEETIGDGYFWEDATYYLRKESNVIDVNGETYNVEVIDEEYGGEGTWSMETYVVLKVGDRLFRKTGLYRSHYGNDWEGPLVEVEKYQRSVTDYREV